MSDTPEREPWFLDCENEEGGMSDASGTALDIYEMHRRHRYAVPGEPEEILAWMETAPVGGVLHYSKGIIVRVDPASERTLGHFQVPGLETDP